MDLEQFETRKQDHIRYALDPANQAGRSGGLEDIHLVHEALPELDFDEVTLASDAFGITTKTPLFVPGMTAGHQHGRELNERLARACERRGWVLGVGSQRRDLESTETDEWVGFRKRYPHLCLVGNIGISQVIHSGPEAILRLADRMETQAIAVHLNALQEALQPEGTPTFRGGLAAIERLAKAGDRPIIVKETGCGMSKETLRRLFSTGVRAVDVSGRGGTHWGRIEGRRAPVGSVQNQAAETFASWGESTVDSVQNAVASSPGQAEVWASGGVRSGLDVAKLIALGSRRVGLAQPALRAALVGDESLDQWMTQIEFELKLALFCTGSRQASSLRQKQGGWKWISQT